MGYANYARIEQSQSDIRGKNDCCMPTLMFDFATLISAFYEPVRFRFDIYVVLQCLYCRLSLYFVFFAYTRHVNVQFVLHL